MPTNDTNKLKVLFISSEVAPFSKSGGLGDVASSLPKELCRQGVDCRVVTPKYQSIPENLMKGLTFKKAFETSLSWRKQQVSVYELNADGVITYFIGNDYYFARDGYYGYGDDFERFGFFSKAAVELAGVLDFKPDIIHTNDWQTGLVSVYLRDKLSKFVYFKDAKTLFTIHNLQYQGVFGRSVLSNLDLDDGYFSTSGLEFYNNISLLKAGITYSDAISTVSETYAGEIQTPAYGFSMDGIIRAKSNSLYGIINGIDYDTNNPETDPHIYTNFSADTVTGGKQKNKAALQKEFNLPVKPDTPLFAIISRLADQKGLDILAVIMDEFFSKDIQLVVLGQGDGRYEQLINYYCYKYPDKCRAHIGFNSVIAQKIYASADFFLMPSLFEPCGLGQLTAMRYGTLPIVRKTGGLADTVRHFDKNNTSGNGFAFEDYLASGLMWAINKALTCYADKRLINTAVKNAMACDYSWANSAAKYIALYKKLKV